MPKYLFIHLNRFEESSEPQHFSKLHSRFDYPLTLDLDTVLPTPSTNSSRDVLSPPPNQPAQPPTQLLPVLGTFTLKALINHQGASLDQGHYFSLTKRPLNGAWWFCNDSDIRCLGGGAQ